MLNRRFFVFLTLAVPVFPAPGMASSQARSGEAVVRGRVTVSGRAEPLPGVEVTLQSEIRQGLSFTAISADDGTFELHGVPAGRYTLAASLPGFKPLQKKGIRVGQEPAVQLDLELSVTLESTVNVVAQREGEVPQTGTSRESVAGGLVDVLPVSGDDYRALLPLLPGVVRSANGRIVMKGGRSAQSSLVVNSTSNLTDPATGEAEFNLPSDAIDSVEVLPNPYGAEYGRFSSGLTNILTRQGTNEWKFTINNFLPRLKFRDNTLMGIGSFTPRVGIRGPLVKNRLFLAQTLQYKVVRTRIPDAPNLAADRKLESVDAFTQIDFQIDDGHDLSAVFSLFPRKLDFDNLDPFNPEEVTYNLHRRGHNIGLKDQLTLSPTTILESTFSYKRLDADIFGQGLREMELIPDKNEGNFFNTQRRETRTFQWVEQLTFLVQNGSGQHLIKLGADLLHSSLDGSSESRPVNIRRADKTLNRRITFGGPTSQRERSTDFAAFIQDRWRINDRLLVELGLRLDRDGVLKDSNLSPRLGLVIGILPEERGVLRGGAGFFYERTALNVGAFESFEPRTVERFEADGVTPAGKPLIFKLETAPDLDAPKSFIWNVEYDHRFKPGLLLKVNYLRRHGFDEFLVDVDEPNAALLLDSRGRSRYWELETSLRASFGNGSHLIFSYVRSDAKADLNSFDRFYGNFRQPVIRPNEFSLADTDAPDRFLLHGTIELPRGWKFSPVLEVRDGFPFSVVDENQDFVGSRNRAGRFPTVVTLDIDVQRWVRFKGKRFRIGFRIFNVLNRFNPRVVQNNIDASNFGTFLSQITRSFGGTLQFEP